MLDCIEKSSDKLGGTPMFEGTRIPVYLLFEYLQEGHTIEEFIDQHDTDPDLVYRFVGALSADYSSKEKVSA